MEAHRIQHLNTANQTTLTFPEDVNVKDILKVGGKLYPIYITGGKAYIKCNGKKIEEGQLIPNEMITGLGSNRTVDNLKDTTYAGIKVNDNTAPPVVIKAEKFFIGTDNISDIYLLPLHLKGLWTEFKSSSKNLESSKFKELKEYRVDNSVDSIIFENPKIIPKNAQGT